MENISIDIDELKSLLSSPREVSRGNLVCTCPFCGKKEHFYIHKETQLYQCKKCKEEGNIVTLLKNLGRLDLLKKNLYTFLSKNKVFNFKKKEDSSYHYKKPDCISLPFGSKRIKSHPYLQERGLSEEEIMENEFYQNTIVPSLSDYILFPIKENGCTVGYIQRVVYSKEKLKIMSLKAGYDILRYKNSEGVNFGELIDGIDEVTPQTHTLIVVEGRFDRISVKRVLRGHGEVVCIATFGNSFTKSQINKVSHLYPSIQSIILMYDIDAINETKKYGAELNYFFSSVLCCEVKSGKDPGEMDELQLLQTLQTLKPLTEYSLSTLKFNFKKKKWTN